MKSSQCFVSHDHFSQLITRGHAYENGVSKVVYLILEPVNQTKSVIQILI